MLTPITAPALCPECGGNVLAETDAKSGIESFTCTNVACPGRMISHFTYIGDRAVLNIDGLGDVLAEQFVRGGIAPSLGYLWLWGKEAEALTAADQNGFEADCTAAGYSVAQVRNLISGLAKARTVPWDRWLQALGIPGVAREGAKALANHLALMPEDLPQLPGKLLTLQLGQVPGLGPERLKGILRWATDPSVAMDLQLLYDSGVRPASTIVSGDGNAPLAGRIICITGEFGEARESIQRKLESLGAVCKASVTKQVNLLLVGEGAGRNKTQKAAERGVQTEGRDWLVQALKSGGLELADNGLPSDEELDAL